MNALFPLHTERPYTNTRYLPLYTIYIHSLMEKIIHFRNLRISIWSLITWTGDVIRTEQDLSNHSFFPSYSQLEPNYGKWGQRGGIIPSSRPNQTHWQTHHNLTLLMNTKKTFTLVKMITSHTSSSFTHHSRSWIFSLSLYTLYSSPFVALLSSTN